MRVQTTARAPRASGDGQLPERWPPVCAVSAGRPQNGAGALQRLTKLDVFFPHNPVTTRPGAHPNYWKVYVHQTPRSWMLMEVLFIIAQTREWPRCPSAGE